jgi:squalene-hopene/tetraprenyl-beta-curcumene cyclase
MASTRRALHGAFSFVVLFLFCPATWAGDEVSGWKPEAAGKYLDGREKEWFAFDSRGQGATTSTCVSCHSVLPYALARPALRKFSGERSPGEWETKLLAQTRMRVQNWERLDTEAFGLFYNDSDRMKRQSWGTEAVFNAAILAFDDTYQGRTSPSPLTKQAFKNLWQTQVKLGDNQGSWEWLDFREPPWGSAEARYFGAALAAIAVATAPGYDSPGADPETDAGITLMRGYLKSQFPKQNLHDRAWGLWAATKLEGVLTTAQQQKLIDQLRDMQRPDGGWSLPSLGTWVRNDRTAQDTSSDGYATALIVHVLQTAGVPKDDEKVVKGLEWLKNNQTSTGAWRSVSLVKKRDPSSHKGKFMSDAATAFAVLALDH